MKKKIGAIDQKDMGLNPDLSLDFFFNSEYWLSGLVDPTVRKLSHDVTLESVVSIHHWRSMFEDEFSNGPELMWQMRHWPTPQCRVRILEC